MKKILFLFALILLTNCDYGDLIIENFNFGNAVPTGVRQNSLCG